tara:strand:- start:349 stop:474 length:126 start_codon:yes stop_codon:yes gene_type:complete
MQLHSKFKLKLESKELAAASCPPKKPVAKAKTAKKQAKEEG